MQLNVTPYGNLRCTICMYLYWNKLAFKLWESICLQNFKWCFPLLWKDYVNSLVSSRRVDCILITNFRGKLKPAGPNIGSLKKVVFFSLPLVFGVWHALSFCLQPSNPVLPSALVFLLFESLQISSQMMISKLQLC